MTAIDPLQCAWPADMEDRREIPWEEGEQFARDNGIDLFAEVSAKTGNKVEEARTTLCLDE